MRERRADVHVVQDRIKRAQAHSTRMVCNRQVHLAAIGSYPAAKVPGRCQVRIEHKRAINGGRCNIKVTVKPGKRMAASRQRNGVAQALLDLRRTHLLCDRYRECPTASSPAENGGAWSRLRRSH